ncbi:MAG: D-isomer specific 2-hydroxyacid dehydrogenase [Micavibrio sp.]|nr:MAG: D-isomer specific 2-hydroxyacid dehydrogenase [Micavibrio sp.]
MKKTALIIQHFLLPAEMKVLEENFRVIRLWKERDPEATIQENKKNIVAVVSSLLPVSTTLIEALPNLEIIANMAVGVDNIPMDVARARGIAVTNTPDVLTDDTANVGLSLVLALARRIVEGDMYVRVGKWQNGPLPLGVSLTGKKAGIAGLGRIGKAVAKRLEAFDMDVVYHGRSKQEDQPYEYYEDLVEMAKAVDFLVLCCAGGPETENLVNYKVLEALGPKGFLVNIARGSVVNEEDLLIILRNQGIAGAGLDVFAAEPHVPEALLTMDNVVLLPHIGSATFETRTEMGQLVVRNLLAHFDGEPLLTPYQ